MGIIPSIAWFLCKTSAIIKFLGDYYAFNAFNIRYILFDPSVHIRKNISML